MEDIKLLQLLSSRICHDLISPIGAIQSGLELLPEVEDKEEVMSLISQSARSAAQRLNYFRASFGYASDRYFHSFPDIEIFIRGFVENQNIQLNWSGIMVVQDPPSWGRLITNTVLLLVEVSPHGGTLHIQFTDSMVTLTMGGKSFPLRPEIVETLEGRTPPDRLSSQTIQSYLTYIFAKNLNLKLKSASAPQGVVKIDISGLLK